MHPEALGPGTRPPRLSKPIGDPDGAWGTGGKNVILPIPTDVLEELERHRPLLDAAVPPHGMTVDNTPLPALRQHAAELLRTRLDARLGFIILRGIESTRFPPPAAENIFWRFCAALGDPLAQRGDGIRFGRVANLGLPASARPRYHETGVGGSVHTDSPIMAEVADLVGLLCIRGAAAGGESKFVSVARVHDILLSHAEDLLAELYEPFFFDRRVKPEDVSPSNPAVLQAPIFTYDPTLGTRGLRLRWQPEYVWEAPGLPDVPALGERQQLALHLLEGVLEDRADAITLRVRMQPGDMQFLNNHTVAHGRTPFLDDPGGMEGAGPNPSTRREMRRVWLRRRC